MDIVLPACGRNQHRRISGSAPKRVRPVWIGAENSGIAVRANLRAPFKRVRTARIDGVVFQLVDISVRTKDGTVGGIEALEKSVAEADCRLGVIDGWKNGRATNVAERDRKTETRRYRSRIFQRGAALMIEKLHAESRVDGRLVGISGRAAHLIQTKSPHELGLVRNSMIDAHGKLVRAGGHLGGRRIGARAKGSLWFIGKRIAGQHGGYRGIYRNGQRVAGKCSGIDSLPLGERGHWKHLRGSQHLPETLIFAKIKCLATAIVNAWKHQRSAVSRAKLVANKGRNPARVES